MVIVDDDLAVRSLVFSLETEGIAVRAFVSGAELLRRFRTPAAS